MSDTTELEERVEHLRTRVDALRDALGETFLGQREVVDLVFLCLVAEGHCLLEGAPGLGKTTLVKGLSSALDLSFSRVQFTPDLMPADILGTRILEETASGGHTFRFDPGPIFANLVLADEINRATPRTQSALLEAMQERQVTVFGETRRLDEPFCVIATQNPIEMEGTYPLPEAQLDRFLCKIEIESPSVKDLTAILQATTGERPPMPSKVLAIPELLEMRTLLRQVPVAEDIVARVARLIRATDPTSDQAPDLVRQLLRFGSSPRGGQSILLLAKARALLSGRPWVSEDDINHLAAPALRHRLVFGYEGEASGVHPDEIIAQALAASS